MPANNAGISDRVATGAATDIGNTPDSNPANPPTPEPSPKPSSAPTGPVDPLADRLRLALAGLPEADRLAVVQHVESLTRLSAAKRQAVLTLTRS